ncbi:hypothetical protein T310_1599 [Neofusicoccum parvum]|uniref:Uncharacterized protein n=1 Tax=Neofusicoccum parvum TaxID=310453 RepID=A0ACB5SB13_9PEZI|nr:hypothetical protein T310_1599 [Neofusicoccum parvum]
MCDSFLFVERKKLMMPKLNVIIVGAGIGGLSAALALATHEHYVTVLDSLSDRRQVGAGIRVPPNSSRLLLDWGVNLDSVKKVISHGNRFVDWKGRKLLDVSYDDMEEKYGIPYYLIHRADLINALLEAAARNSYVKVKTNNRVVEYNFSDPSVKTEQGDWYSGDLVLSVEGIKSSVRTAVNGEPLEPRDTGDVAYRILVPSGPLLNDPKTRHLVQEPWATHWIGPEAHAVGYPLRDGELYNIIIDVTHRTDKGTQLQEEEWRKQADNKELVERFKGWCYPVQKLCGLTGEYLKWKLVDFNRPLERWVHPSGKVALLGDACHPMMPYMAQGAAQAIEDAGVLRAALANFSNIPQALSEYQQHRAPRAEYIVKNTRVLQEWIHLYDGAAQERRDELMRYDDLANPIFWAHTLRKDWLFGYDPQNVLSGEDDQIPELPPLPPPEASVYSGSVPPKL